MSIVDFIAVVSFGLTCFSIGYAFGKDNHKTQKQPPTSNQLKRLFLLYIFGLTVYRQHSFFYNHITIVLIACQEIGTNGSQSYFQAGK